MPTTAILALEDGRCFSGIPYGATGTTTGEICFNTSMTGYQEVITDPSYRGQIVAMTYPMIGNYGVNPADNESAGPHIRAFVIGELCEIPSNYRSTEALAPYLERHNILGIEGIDTRALTKHLRSLGAMRACVTTELCEAEAVEAANNSAPMAGSDFVKEVTTKQAYTWTEESRKWTLPNASIGETETYQELPEAKYKVVALDLGLKYNQLRMLRQAGFEVEVVPASTSAADILAKNPDGLFLTNGPGDPSALGYIHDEIKELITKLPTFGICLGNQLLAHAYGGKTFKLKFGHRGGNQPVKDLRSGKISITSQNHGFAVDPDSLPDEIEVTHINLNDNTVEGMRHKTLPVFSVQYHPEAAPGPNDAAYFFAEFAELIEENKKNRE
ncbi:MAG: glutamine-hydrolyzing carbamoyl-phosphate synthase small subunit [Akkermansiaceae bacterium]|nr:glutamine-hydrolyzing carbamoyl-phosphate synthase small subunit [Akkermansiaceae bacterium]